MTDEDIREGMRAYLAGHGVKAVTAWPGEERRRYSGAVCVVSLRECKVSPAGFQDYLGERYSEETGLWEELYGRRAQVTFGLDLYAPPGDGGELQRAFDALATALGAGGPEGISVKELRCGETGYDQKNRLLRRSAEAVCQTWLLRTGEPEEMFTDFELRGRQSGDGPRRGSRRERTKN